MNQANNTQQLEIFAEKYYKIVAENSVDFDGRRLTFKVKSGENADEFKSILEDLFSGVNKLLDGKFEVVLDSLKLIDAFAFFDPNDYFNRYEKYKNNFDSSTILLLKCNDEYIVKSEDEPFSTEKALIFNYISYREILEFLQKTPNFTTLYHPTNNEFIIVSKDNGVFHIGFKYYDDRIKNLPNLDPLFNELKANFEKKEFVQFFKEIITNAGIHEKATQDRFFELLRNLKILLSLTEKDYETYVLEFSFEKLKSKFKEERNKYFESIEKNIDTVGKQIFSFPLTFSAAAFASYQVKEKPLILLLILVGYLLYTGIAYYVLSIVLYNVKCLLEDVTKEECEIKLTYRKLYSDFQQDFEKIKTKIRKLKTLAWTLIGILTILICSFIVFSIYQFNTALTVDDKQTIKVETKNIKVKIDKGQILDEKNSLTTASAKNTDSLKLLKSKSSNIKTPQ